MNTNRSCPAQDRRIDPSRRAAAGCTAGCSGTGPGPRQACAISCIFCVVPSLTVLGFQFIVHFHQAVLDNNLPEITVAYESGWNKLTEKFYAKVEWPEAEIIAPLVNDGALAMPIVSGHTSNFRSYTDQIFLILYRELYYRHVYSRIQPDIDDRFHSYENSCELFNYLLSQ